MIRPAALEERASRSRSDVGGVDDVLDADRHAVQRADALAARRCASAPGLRQRALAVEIGPGLDLGLERGDAVEAGARD